MVGTVFCYFIAISFGIAIPIIIIQIPLREKKARVIELEQKLQRLENKYKAEQELKLATLEKKLVMGRIRYERTMRSLNSIKDKQIKLIQKLENYKNKLEQDVELNYQH
ncbi:TPA: hypothetical protein ACPKA2_001008 [Haemophilus influenzae]|uniref:hypothetical protein n=1 Tax=Haemophilus influenzae TaxID=727 RepID=UPI001864BD1F|nr:hypothetical protein [Haemophilus influenzae]